MNKILIILNQGETLRLILIEPNDVEDNLPLDC